MAETKSKNLLKLFLKEAGFFLLAHAVGLFVVFRLTTTTKGEQILEETASGATTTAWGFLLYLGIAVIFFLLAMRFLKQNKLIFKIIFALALFGGLDVAFNTVLAEPWAFFLAVALVGARFYFKNIYVHNFVIVLAVAGAGATLGVQFEPLAALFVLVGLVFYDIIAVYGTKHMVKMAKGMAQKGALFALVIPQKGADTLQMPKQLKTGGKFAVLGAGDLAIPLLFSASIAKGNLLGGAIISLSALLGLGAMNFLFSHQEKPKAMPALPPICLGAILGYLIVLFL